MSRRIVIELYDHTPNEEILEILEAIECMGIDGAIVEGHDGQDITESIG